MATRRFKFAACVLGTVLMLNPALSTNVWAHGGGGGGGGGHGGGGFGGGGFGGGHGGFGGGGWGGGHSGWGGGGWGTGGGTYIGGGHTGGYYGGHSANYGGTGVGRGINSGVAGTGRSLGNSGFTSRHFAGTGATGITSAGRLATGSHNMQNNFNHFNHRNNIFFGFGYPFFLYGFPFGYGYLGYGYGYGGYGYGNYGYGYGYPAAYTTNVQPTAEQLASATDFTNQGEEAFMAGRYQEAVQKWQHALVDNPNNGGLMLLLSQALFAVGQFDPAAGALQLSLRMLPQSQWNTVVANYKELYPDIQKYTDQLRVLEKARTDNPKNPALRFLLGYHYGYLGYPKNAVEELDKAIQIQPKDELAVDLRNLFAKQAGMPEVPATQEKPATSPATQATPPAAEKKTS